MRLLSLFLSILLISGVIYTQQKYLISPNQEVIPITKYTSVSKEIEKQRNKMTERIPSSVSGACGTKFNFGFTEDVYPPVSNFGIYHKDVLGQWYVAPASGSIDTIFWVQNLGVGPADSTINVRIHVSNITNTSGPGRGPWVNAAPCQSWGYWKTTNDADNHIAAFLTDLSPSEDKTWYSTINELQNGNVIPATTAPFGLELFGEGVGLPVRIRPLTVEKANIAGTGLAPTVVKGSAFFISFRGDFPNEHISGDTHRTGFDGYGSATNTTTADENWPARDWKFYEHDSGPSPDCAGVNINLVKRGWVARGPIGSNVNVMATGGYNIWYTMTVTTNVPPLIKNITNGDPHNTFSNAAQSVAYDIWDCDPEKLDSAGVKRAWIKWSTATDKAYIPATEFVSHPDIPMSYSGSGDEYDADIPGQPARTVITYQVYAEDLRGMVNIGPVRTYKVTTIKNNFYLVDTNYACTHTSILSTGTSIDTAAFFINNAIAGHGPERRDDGTAGPFSLGGPMQFFGDTVSYAWVGVNGAIALSKGIADTIDVNANGWSTTGWDFPMRSHHYRADTLHPSYMPPNFVAPFWADMVLGDTVKQYGKILTGDGGDACKFITEWNNIGTFDANGSVDDITTFRVVLNRCDGTLEFQYDNVGTHGLDSAATVGMQADSNALTAPNTTTDPGHVYINRNLYPYQSKPRNNWCIKFTPGSALYVDAGWQLLSVANNRGSDYAKASVYPDAISDAFKYTTSYVPTTTLSNGPGFWLKFNKYTYAGAPGSQITDLSIPVTKGWNLVGSISKPVITTSIVKSAGVVLGSFFRYGPPYLTTTTIMPGRGLWVKNTGTDAGTIQLTVAAQMPKVAAPDYSLIDQLTIQDKSGRFQTLFLGEDAMLKSAQLETGEWPPAMPEFDARFKNTGSMVASYPAKVENSKLDYPISVSTDAYPLTVRWDVAQATERKVSLYNGNKLMAVLEGSGSIKIQSNAGLRLSLGSVNVPKEFALGQNYPNPFNPTTRFTVDVPRATNVDVVVYDLLGRKITTLMTGEQGAGSYQMEWNGTDAQNITVPTGTYFIRMSADKFSAVQKVMLMK